MPVRGCVEEALRKYGIHRIELLHSVPTFFFLLEKYVSL